jgi:hypothetical protein
MPEISAPMVGVTGFTVMVSYVIELPFVTGRCPVAGPVSEGSPAEANRESVWLTELR